MDFSLRCNSLNHIFCITCSKELGLARADTAIRVCPACDTPLSNPDDAVETRLDPTEDYKTSVLSGLGPTIIMECAGRALAFYSYQTTQEIMYQEYLARSLTEKYTMLNVQMDKVVHDANSEIANLREKLQTAQQEQKRLEDEMHKMADAYKEKAKTQAHLHKVYTQLKAQVLAGQFASAASDDAEATLQSATGDRFIDKLTGPAAGHQRFPAGRNVIRLESRRRSNGSADNAPVGSTPQHRTRLGDANGQTYHPMGPGVIHPTPMSRLPLTNLNPNSFSRAGGNGYGLSAGMRTGKQVPPINGPRGAWGPGN
ncbi:hypothetical protein SLS56_008740 [Neofusicoccum ribis]|uniref:E3 ubiquitin-protein ligase CCNB1IP1 n=1 Tax=Neofusicoccum ribis TaxID=45134 RepID=A0ABR3SJV4_9PEZI